MSVEHLIVGGYRISDDRSALDFAMIHRFLSEESYWAAGIPRDEVERAAAASLCFGLYAPDGGQCGYGRVVSDFTGFAWISDVFVLQAHRGRGLGKVLLATILGHPSLAQVRRCMLATRDAHALYAGFGFGALPEPSHVMVRQLAPAWARPGGPRTP